jgi:predicted ester cyclase
VEDNGTKFRRLIELGFGQGDMATVDEIVDAGCVEHQRGNNGGAEGAKEVITTLHRWFSDFELKVVDLVVDGDKVWARNRARGVNTGSIMGRPPSGAPIEIEVFDVGRFAGGKLVEHWGVPDQMGVMLQVGAIPRG